MVFNALELQGFKSFPDKTHITFESGVTAIIGPNGSGKSNISDAVRWVLGEMSLKSLRGSRMEDVLFNGTQTRGAANYAYVTLQLTDDNGEELSVTRKYFRSGESEYLLNKKSVRLKDVYERFYDTGIGREGYSVIGQGKIAEVLSQKGDERRSIFEEAAGISKYRYKKAESERKLEAADNNLLRINDILGEITSRLKPLEKEAENAKKYLVLSEEKKGLEITLWIEKIEKYKAELETGTALFESAKKELEERDAKIAQTEKDLDDVINAGYDISRTLAQAQKTISDADVAISEYDGKIAVKQNDIQHYGRVFADSQAEKVRIEADLSAAEASIEASAAAVIAAKNDLSAAKAEFENSRDENVRRRECAEKTSLEEETLRISYEQAVKRHSDSVLLAATVENELENLKKSASVSQQQLFESTERIDEIAKKIENTSKQIDGFTRDLAKIRKEFEKLCAERENIKEKEKEAESNIASLRTELSSLEQRRDTLEKMERLFEGYSESVKNVLSAAKDKKLGSGVTVDGVVSSVLTANDEYVVAVETALAAAVQFIIVGTEDDAKACIRFLKSSNGGRATFLPLTTVNGVETDVSAIKNISGYIGVASSLCSYNEKYSGIVKDLLGKTVVAADLDAAVEIARASGYRIKIVTLDGQLIHPGGSFTGGAAAKRVGIFTRAMDIERLNKQISEKNADMIAIERKKRKINTELTVKYEQCDSLYAQLDNAKNESRELDRLKSIELVRREEEARRLSQIEKVQNDANSRIAALTAEYDKKSQSAAACKLQSDEALAAYIAHKAKTEEARADEKRSSERMNELYIVYTNSETVLLRREEQKKLLEERKLAAAAMFVQNERGALAAAESIEAAKASIAVFEAEKSKLTDYKIKQQESINTLLTGREDREKETSAIRAALKEANSAKEEALKAYTSIENKNNLALSEYENVTSALWNEYELTYSSAIQYRLSKEQMQKAPSRLSALKAQIRSMGSINVNAVEEYTEIKERHDFLTAQTDDLKKTKKSLTETITKLESTMVDTFIECFNKINASFGEMFVELFGGGSARVELADPLLPLTCPIDIIIKPPGKSVRNISLLSGGEQSFAAIALYLALQKINPSPFCIFDEIDSALDEVNLGKFADYIRQHSTETQYIIITHRRGTMERADVLYGILMKEKGVSDYLRLNMNQLDNRMVKGIIN